MTSLSSYLLVILIVLIILLTITYTTDYITIPNKISNFFDSSEPSSPPSPTTSSCSNIEYEKIKNNTQPTKYETTQIVKEDTTDITSFLIDNNFATIDSDNINKQLFNQTEDFQMTENTGNAIADALGKLNIDY